MRRQVQIGDRFVRVSTYACLHEIFVVVAIRIPAGHPPHARLLGESTGDVHLIAVALARCAEQVAEPTGWNFSEKRPTMGCSAILLLPPG